MNINNICSIEGSSLAIVLLFVIIGLILLIVLIIRTISNKREAKINNKAPTTQQPIQPQKEASEPEQCNAPNSEPFYPQPPPPQRSHSIGIIFLKLLLLACLVVFALWNYRLFDFSKGWSKTEMKNINSFSDAIEFIADGIDKIEYYQVPHNCDNVTYRVHILTSTQSYLLNATSDDIKFLNAAGSIYSKFHPHSVTVIPFYVEIVVGLIVIFIPIGRKKYYP